MLQLKEAITTLVNRPNSEGIRPVPYDLTHSVTDEELRKEAEDILTTMEARMNLPTLRVVGYFFKKIWQKLYQQICVNQEGLETVKEMTDKVFSCEDMTHSVREYLSFTCPLTGPT